MDLDGSMQAAAGSKLDSVDSELLDSVENKVDWDKLESSLLSSDGRI